MYYPFLRARQFELIALRELATEGATQGVIVPILEPVKETHTNLNLAHKVFQEKGQRAYLVVNPKFGELAGDSQFYIEYIAAFNYEVFLPAFHYRNNAEYINQSIEQFGLTNCMLICENDIEGDDANFKTIAELNAVSLITVNDPGRNRSLNRYIRGLQKGFIRLDDLFEKKDRNRIYIDIRNENSLSINYYNSYLTPIAGLPYKINLANDKTSKIFTNINPNSNFSSWPILILENSAFSGNLNGNKSASRLRLSFPKQDIVGNNNSEPIIHFTNAGLYSSSLFGKRVKFPIWNKNLNNKIFKINTSNSLTEDIGGTQALNGDYFEEITLGYINHNDGGTFYPICTYFNLMYIWQYMPDSATLPSAKYINTSNYLDNLFQLVPRNKIKFWEGTSTSIGFNSWLTGHIKYVKIIENDILKYKGMVEVGVCIEDTKVIFFAVSISPENEMTPNLGYYSNGNSLSHLLSNNNTDSELGKYTVDSVQAIDCIVHVRKNLSETFRKFFCMIFTNTEYDNMYSSITSNGYNVDTHPIFLKGNLASVTLSNSYDYTKLNLNVTGFDNSGDRINLSYNSIDLYKYNDPVQGYDLLFASKTTPASYNLAINSGFTIDLTLITDADLKKSLIKSLMIASIHCRDLMTKVINAIQFGVEGYAQLKYKSKITRKYNLEFKNEILTPNEILGLTEIINYEDIDGGDNSSLAGFDTFCDSFINYSDYVTKFRDSNINVEDLYENFDPILKIKSNLSSYPFVINNNLEYTASYLNECGIGYLKPATITIKLNTNYFLNTGTSKLTDGLKDVNGNLYYTSFIKEYKYAQIIIHELTHFVQAVYEGAKASIHSRILANLFVNSINNVYEFPWYTNKILCNSSLDTHPTPPTEIMIRELFNGGHIKGNAAYMCTLNEIKYLHSIWTTVLDKSQLLNAKEGINYGILKFHKSQVQNILYDQNSSDFNRFGYFINANEQFVDFDYYQNQLSKLL